MRTRKNKIQDDGALEGIRMGGSFYGVENPCAHHTCACLAHMHTVETGVTALTCHQKRLPRSPLISIIAASGIPHYMPLKDGRTPIPRKLGEKIFTMPIYRKEQVPLAPQVKKYMESKVADISSSNVEKRSGRHLAYNIPELEHDSIDLIKKIEQFARADSTIGDISNLLDLDIMDVISISRTNGIYVHDGAREREWVSTIVDLAARGKSIDEIFFESEIPRQSIHSLSQRVVSANGSGAQILADLLIREEECQSSEDRHLASENHLSNKEEIMIDVSVAQDSKALRIGRKIRVRSDAPGANPNLEGRQDQDATIISVLDHVISIKFDDDDIVLARDEEIRILVGDTEWKVGEEVMFKLDGGLVVGVVETLILNYKNTGVRYIVTIDGVQDIISPSEFVQ